MLGLPVGYALACWGKQGRGPAAHVGRRHTVLGNSWNVSVIPGSLEGCSVRWRSGRSEVIHRLMDHLWSTEVGATGFGERSVYLPHHAISSVDALSQAPGFHTILPLAVEVISGWVERSS